MGFLIAVTGGVVAVYVFLFLAYALGWTRLPSGPLEEKATHPFPLVTVVIAARDEEDNIADCLASLEAQTYPASSLEILVVDDHSRDRTALIAQSFADRLPLRVLSLAKFHDPKTQGGAFKKQALSLGIRQAQGTQILTTDADCILGPDWVRTMSQALNDTGTVMALGPVKYRAKKDLLGLFQSLDFMAMQGITGAVNHFRLGIMGNGANLGFRKSSFEQVGGYQGVDHLASGDDYLLMHKMRAAFGHRFRYIKAREAIVHTKPPESWAAFWSQRIRWASKMGSYQDPFVQGSLVLVYLMNAGLLAWTIYALLTGNWRIAAGMGLAKLLAELCLMIPLSRFFGPLKWLIYFPLLQPLHCIYVLVAGVLAWKRDYHWKGRRTR